MTKADWDDGGTRQLGMFLNGEEIVTPDERGQRIVDDSFVLLFNAGHEDAELTLPPRALRRAVDLRAAHGRRAAARPTPPARPVRLSSRSLVLLRRTAT